MPSNSSHNISPDKGALEGGSGGVGGGVRAGLARILSHVPGERTCRPLLFEPEVAETFSPSPANPLVASHRHAVTACQAATLAAAAALACVDAATVDTIATALSSACTNIASALAQPPGCVVARRGPAADVFKGRIHARVTI
jgi:hypothetical protein